MPHDVITPDLLLQAYASGIFPMSEGREDEELFWVEPDERGIIPFKNFHASSSLRKTLRKEKFLVTINRAFSEVMEGCAEPGQGRESTWISNRIQDLYCDLNSRGFAHSIECWNGDKLVGGLYGVCLPGAFFGESMFSRERDASKVALVYLIARLIKGGFVLLDTQFVTDHLKKFGAVAIEREEYKQQLHRALEVKDSDFYRLPESASTADILQLITQTS